MHPLQLRVNSLVKPLVTRIENFPIEDKLIYAIWMAQTYYYASYSTKILDMASEHALTEPFKKRFSDHSSEESKHELMALKDVKKCGYQIDQIPELESTKAMYQTQYFLIQEHGGESLMGWILALEGLAVMACEGAYLRAKESHGGSASTFLKVHAEEDPDHLEKAIMFASTIEDQVVLEKNIVDTVARYNQMLDEIESFASALKQVDLAA